MSHSEATEPELERLMRLSREGNHEAFAQFFEMRRELLTREVRRKLGTQLQARVAASDVMQEVFLVANRRLEEVGRTDVPLLAWLRVLLNQHIVDLMRKHLLASKRSVRREQGALGSRSEVDLLAEKLAGAITSPSMRVHRKQLQARVRELLDELSTVDRQILVLRHFHGKSNAEVAEELGLSVNAASNRYVRALRRFRQVLDSETGSEQDV